MASLADWIKSQTTDYGQLKEAYPNAIKFGSALKKGISDLVPTTEELQNPTAMSERAINYLNPMAGTMGIAKNLNSDLLQKYLTTGKLSPKEMAQYEANGLAMETPQLQRYNLGNANAQGGSPESRALDMNYPSFKNNEYQYYPLSKKDNVSKDVADVTNYLSSHGIPYKPDFAKTTKSVYLNMVGEPYSTVRGGHSGSDLQIRLSDHGKNIKKTFQKQSPDDEYIADVFANGGHSVEDAINNIKNTKGLRSRFAAFDPLRKNSSSLLASLLGGTALVGQYNKEKKMKEMR